MNTMNLRDKYNHAIQTAKNVRMDGSAQERDGKLHFTGTVTSEAEKNAIWDAIKTIPDWRNDVVADLTVMPKPGVDAPVSSMKTYTVKAMQTTTCASSRPTRISSRTRTRSSPVRYSRFPRWKRS
jgi:hypothetical protein